MTFVLRYILLINKQHFMNKVGIITILKVNNYGAELQAYATQAILNAIGYDAEIIDYLFYKNPGHIKTGKSKPVFKFGLKKKLAEWGYPIKTLITATFSKGNNETRKKRFEKFHSDNTKLSKCYRSIDELYKADLDYDTYVVGSDQVWNPGIYSSILPYMLDFAPAGKRRISYASSFGVSSIAENQQAFYKEHLSKFSAISVREKNAVELVKELSGKEATWVLDPTFLLNKEDWMKVAKYPYDIRNRYILVYELIPSPYLMELAKIMSQEKGMTIVRICKDSAPETKEEGIISITDAGPAEFIGLFANADMIVTNSFHGTAFSVNFGKDFYTVTPLHKQNNSRQQSLLGLFSLNDRLLLEGTDINTISRTPIDYNAVNSKLEEEREKSINYLKSAIDDK